MDQSTGPPSQNPAEAEDVQSGEASSSQTLKSGDTITIPKHLYELLGPAATIQSHDGASTGAGCIRCRRSKIKCTQEEPKCSSCRPSNRDCQYLGTGDLSGEGNFHSSKNSKDAPDNTGSGCLQCRERGWGSQDCNHTASESNLSRPRKPFLPSIDSFFPYSAETYEKFITERKNLWRSEYSIYYHGGLDRYKSLSSREDFVPITERCESCFKGLRRSGSNGLCKVCENLCRTYGIESEMNQQENSTSPSSSDREAELRSCKVCSGRGTICDSMKPTCSFCWHMGIPCEYQGVPAHGNEDSPSKAQNMLHYQAADGSYRIRGLSATDAHCYIRDAWGTYFPIYEKSSPDIANVIDTIYRRRDGSPSWYTTTTYTPSGGKKQCDDCRPKFPPMYCVPSYESTRGKRKYHESVEACEKCHNLNNTGSAELWSSSTITHHPQQSDVSFRGADGRSLHGVSSRELDCMRNGKETKEPPVATEKSTPSPLSKAQEKMRANLLDLKERVEGAQTTIEAAEKHFSQANTLSSERSVGGEDMLHSVKGFQAQVAAMEIAFREAFPSNRVFPYQNSAFSPTIEACLETAEEKIKTVATTFKVLEQAISWAKSNPNGINPYAMNPLDSIGQGFGEFRKEAIYEALSRGDEAEIKARLALFMDPYSDALNDQSILQAVPISNDSKEEKKSKNEGKNVHHLHHVSLLTKTTKAVNLPIRNIAPHSTSQEHQRLPPSIAPKLSLPDSWPRRQLATWHEYIPANATPVKQRRRVESR
ncbi:hypothetical protein G7Y89_g10584 [Cudoniella acicularis]|uniref:Zn(2)-C6 fungal-type domain-containing protein n=1 Tax=Cudoniella acicularis TaxID=354080 RepID=A0A8H4W0T5_9HELO|nr:hypothetical protein G7Y89_g10584 [Cudoniella acicularis]